MRPRLRSFKRMQHQATAAIWFLATMALLLWLSGRWRAAELVGAEPLSRAEPYQRPPESPVDDEQPETDRAPRRRFTPALTVAVAATATVRLGLLFALGC